jgi:hypothetical protein
MHLDFDLILKYQCKKAVIPIAIAMVSEFI